ncbi:hypothetical protein ACQPZF_36080 [Actinosynnema sp. CS-041913]|uniref:hypothetical protein n=1 Tax=Actinosynnema sp. CS-041913 TaxID=3239917 RepID=UPI003D916F3B
MGVVVLGFALLVGWSLFAWIDDSEQGNLASGLTAAVAAVGAITSLIISIRQRRVEEGMAWRGRSDAQRANEVRAHLSAATRVLKELEGELGLRIRVLEQHQRDAERYEQLASLNAEQAKAIENLVGRQFARQSRMTWVQWVGSLLAAFALGLVVNWISAPALDWVRQLLS